MTSVDRPKATSGLVQRVTNILMKPDAEWAVIEGEPATVPGLFTGYAAILAAIGPICGIVGHSLLGGLLHWSIVTSIIWAVMTWLFSLVGAFVCGLVVEALAPSFGGQKDQVAAMKAAVYSMTAAWVAGVFQLFLPLAILILIAGLYGIYLLYLGLPRLMKAPKEKAVAYTAVVVIVMILIQWVIAMIVGSIMLMGVVSGLAGVR